MRRQIRGATVLLVSCLWLILPVHPSGVHGQVQWPAAASPGRIGRGAQSIPAGLHQVFERTLRQEKARPYRVQRAGHLLQAPNAAQGMRLIFGRSGVDLTTGAGNARRNWSMRLQGIGRGGHMQPVAQVQPTLRGDHVVYRRGGLIEWYRNTAQGLEQGFTVPQPVGGQRVGQVVLALRVGGTLHPQLSQGGTELALGGSGLVLRELVVRDALERLLPAHFTLQGQELRIVIETRHAVYPLQVDPWLQQAELSASQAGLFGDSVAVSANGTTALVGAPDEATDTGISGAGVAYVYSWSGTGWSFQQKLTASDAAGSDQFGTSVSLSGDGSTVLIGAYNKWSSAGAAYVFTRSGTTWSQQQELTASDPAPDDQFGHSVSLSTDGTTALIGAWNKASSTGAAYILTRSGMSWAQAQKLSASDAAQGDSFGFSVSLNGDGSTALIGAYAKASLRGAAYIFTRSGTTWSQQQELTADDAVSFDVFGLAVSLSGDGLTALIGAPGKGGFTGAAYTFFHSAAGWNSRELVASDPVGNDNFGRSVSLGGDGTTVLIGAYTKASGAGAAYVFTGSGTSWSQPEKLTAYDGAPGDSFGSAVALNGDGSRSIIGAPGKASSKGTVADAGAAYIFLPSGTSRIFWEELTSAQPDDEFGVSVSLSKDENTALIGTADHGGLVGAAYVFTRSGTTWSRQQRFAASDLTAAAHFGYSVSLSGDGATALVGAYGEAGFTGAAYVFVRSADTTWSQQGKLTASDAATGDLFGGSVSLSGDGNTALIGAGAKASNTGAAYVFTRSGTTWNRERKLTAGDGAVFDSFGVSVSLSADGSIALIGALSGPNGTGAAYVFTANGTVWIQQKELTASDGAPTDKFAASVSLGGDGTTALIGATGKAGQTGAAYIFTGSGTTWSQQELTANDAAAGDDFGSSVSLSTDGSTALVGANAKAGGRGAAYVFTGSGRSWTQRQKLIAGDPAASNYFGFSVSLSGDGNTALVGTVGLVYAFIQSPATHLTLSPPASPTSGTSFSLTVTAKDDSNAQAFYRGTIHFTSSDPQAVLPTDYTFTSGDDGAHTFAVTLNTPPSQTITVTDVAQTSFTATTGTITVAPLQTAPFLTQGWSLIGGSPVTLWPGVSSLWSWNALTGQWGRPNGTESPGTGTWELVPSQTSHFIYVQRCARAVTIPVQRYRWNMVGNPCDVTVTLPPGTRALLWDNPTQRYISTTTIPPGFAAWVLPISSFLAMTPG